VTRVAQWQSTNTRSLVPRQSIVVGGEDESYFG